MPDCGVPDVDVASLWAQSGGQWLTAPEVGAPGCLVRNVVRLSQYLDVRGAGLAELVGASGLGIIGERAAFLGYPRASSVSCGGATRLLATNDGWVAVTLARPDDILAIPAWLGIDLPTDPWSSVSTVVKERSTQTIVERASLLGLACAAVGEVEDHRGVIALNLGEIGPRPLSGTLVVNLASLWAGPLAADVLARLGARVVTVESTARPDGSRAAPSFFNALHGHCESVALALDTDLGRQNLRALLSQAEVVIEGSRPRALSQMGIDARQLVADGPRVWVSITAHGRSGDTADRVGYGDDTAAAGGLVGASNGTPVFLADAIADPLTGIATAASIVQLLERGGRWLVDIALARVAASVNASDSDSPACRPEPSSPRVRADPGAPLPLGRDSARVLAELGIRA